MDSHTNQDSPRELVKLKSRPASFFQKRRQPQFIFFTGWGCIFVTITFVMLGFSLVNQMEALAFYALLSGACLLFGLFLTHENLRQTTVRFIEILPDSNDQLVQFKITVTNASEHLRKRLRAKIKIKDTSHSALFPKQFTISSPLFDLDEFEEKELVLRLDPNKYLLHPLASRLASALLRRKLTAKPVLEASPGLASVTVESLFPFGLMRSWRIFRAKNLMREQADTSLANLKRLSRFHLEHKDEKNIYWSETPYTNQNATRILWRRFFATGALFARHEEFQGRGAAADKANQPNEWPTSDENNTSNMQGRVASSIQIHKFLLLLLAVFWGFQHFEDFPSINDGALGSWYLALSLPLVAVFAALAQIFLADQSMPKLLQRRIVTSSRALSLLLPLALAYLFFNSAESAKSQTASLALELFPILFLMTSFRHATAAPFLGSQHQRQEKNIPLQNSRFENTGVDSFTGAGLLLLTGCPLFAVSAASESAWSDLAAAVTIFGCYYSLHLTQIKNKSRYYEFHKTDARLLARVFVQIIPLLLVFFTVLAVVPGTLRKMNLWGQAGKKAGLFQTGFGTTLQPGDIALLQDDLTPVLDLTFHPILNGTTESGLQTAQSEQTIYLRGATLSQGFGFNWQQSAADYSALPGSTKISQTESAGAAPDSIPTARHVPTDLIAVEQLQPSDGHLFVPEGFQVKNFTQGSPTRPAASSPVRASARLVAFRQKTFMIFGADPKEPLRYELEPADQTFSSDVPLAAHSLSQSDLHALDLSSEFKKIFEGNTASTREKLKSVESFFRSRPFTYARIQTSSTLEDFLFGSKRGFCEHFAAATASILRFQGLATRIVTGYAGGFKDLSSQKHIFRNSDAHAWLEVWLPEEHKWERVDPTLWAAVSEYNKPDQSSALLRQNAWLAVALLVLIASAILVTFTLYKRMRRGRERLAIPTPDAPNLETRSSAEQESHNNQRARFESEIEHVFEACFGKSRTNFETIREYVSRISSDSRSGNEAEEHRLLKATAVAKHICGLYERYLYADHSIQDRLKLEQAISNQLAELTETLHTSASSKLDQVS